jgi:hypothetical protein
MAGTFWRILLGKQLAEVSLAFFSFQESNNSQDSCLCSVLCMMAGIPEVEEG